MWAGSTVQGVGLCAVLVLIAYLIRRRIVGLLVGGGSVVVTAVVASVLKGFIDRPRPPVPYAQVEALGSSMPSTAAALSTAALASLWSLRPLAPPAKRAYAGALVCIGLVVDFSVVYLGAHWFTDVLVGIVLGGAIGLAGLRLTEGVHRRKRPLAT